VLFNSVEFIFAFFPIAALVFFGLARFSHLLAAGWLTLTSLFFYGWWNPAYVALLLASIVFNYASGFQLARLVAKGRQDLARPLLALAITANLALLGYFKYANFFLNISIAVTGSRLSLGPVVLPLGISFFTFTQIAFLVDAYRGYAKEYNPVHYGLFVSYFPHLIAGPVLHHKEMMPQFQDARTYRVNWDDVAVGLTIFVIGLFKKTVIADGVAPYVTPLFSAHGQPDFLAAWGGALAYTFQLYFDFSGYSDMAIGLSRVFGVKLPLNFDSPYKAVNIIDFWRRWHITLSRFLRDYLYVPLGGNRKGPVRRYVNLMITMVLGGLWHGAGWTFVMWGTLHGLYLVVNHLWRALRKWAGQDPERETVFGRSVARLITFLAVIVGWVFFRATNFGDAVAILRGMAGLNGLSLPAVVAAQLGPVQGVLQAWGVVFTLGGGSRFVLQYCWIVVLIPIALFAPNTQQLLARFQPALDYRGGPLLQAHLLWRPTAAWAALIAMLTAAGLLSLSKVSEFLYYQF
jgi:alginate O-acetyltransferase complex protein AlgI